LVLSWGGRGRGGLRWVKRALSTTTEVLHSTTSNEQQKNASESEGWRLLDGD